MRSDEFYMDKRFVERLSTIWPDPVGVAQELMKRTRKERKRLGCEIPVLITRPEQTYA